MNKLTHLDEHGAARMVDVSEKAKTTREATAEAIIVLSKEAYAAVVGGTAPKGDVFAAARIAGIMAAKKTSELIPLCHPIALTQASRRNRAARRTNTPSASSARRKPMRRPAWKWRR